MLLVSIIIPVYNVEKYLPVCLDSVKKQSYENLEIILINDGSTDKSGEICDSYAKKDSRIKVLHTTNNGVSSARNTGIECANGEAICFIDSDDTVEEDYIANLVNAWVEGKSDLVICNIKDIYPSKIVSKRKVRNKLTGVFRKDYWKLIDLLRVPVVKLYKSDIIKKYSLEFPTTIHTAEDQIWNFNYYSHVNSYSYVDNSLYNYFHRDNNSLSQLKDYKSYLANLTKINLEKEFLVVNKIDNANLVLTNHAFGTLKQFALLSDRDNNYYELKKRWDRIKAFVDTKVDAKTTKQKILFYLIDMNLLLLVYFYYIVNTAEIVPIRRMIKRCTPPPAQTYLMRRRALA